MNRKISAILSLVICILSAIVLVIGVFLFPKLFARFYETYHLLGPEFLLKEHPAYTVIPTFYLCSPFAAAALFMLIRLLVNIIKEKVFVRQNVALLFGIACSCYAVFAVCAAAATRYFPLVIVAFAMGVVGTLLLVVKSVMRSAVELREENDLTI